MTECGINLKVVHFQYNLPPITIKIPKQKTLHHKSSLECKPYIDVRKRSIPDVKIKVHTKTNPHDLIESLLSDIYRKKNLESINIDTSTSIDSETCSSSNYCNSEASDKNYFHLQRLSISSLKEIETMLKSRCQQAGCILVKRLYTRDSLERKQKRLCQVITYILSRLVYTTGIQLQDILMVKGLFGQSATTRFYVNSSFTYEYAYDLGQPVILVNS